MSNYNDLAEFLMKYVGTVNTEFVRNGISKETVAAALTGLWETNTTVDEKGYLLCQIVYNNGLGTPSWISFNDSGIDFIEEQFGEHSILNRTSMIGVGSGYKEFE